jgi:hypothetical protein
MPRLPRPAPGFRGATKLPTAPFVRFVRFDDARALLTIRPQDPVWSGAPPVCPSGAIVRIRPPAEASDADVLRQRDAHERAGAARVRVEPRAAGERVMQAKSEPERPAARTTIRDVVMGMAGESRAHDRTALIDELDRALSEQGV